MLRMALGVALLAAGCAVPNPSYEDASAAVPSPVSTGGYNSVAWLETGGILLTQPNDGNAPGPGRITEMGADGTNAIDITVAKRPECGERWYGGVAPLSMGEVGVVDVCDTGPSGPVGTFIAVDRADGQARELGVPIDLPFDVAWKDDRPAVYSVGGPTCASLYQHGATESPLDLPVSIDGQVFTAGEDILRLPDHCPTHGRAAFPAFSPDGRFFGFVASASGPGAPGQASLDLPWSLFTSDVMTHANLVVNGILHPGGVAWVRDDALVFAGWIGGRHGLWEVQRDGPHLTLIVSVDVAHLAVAPDGSMYAALVDPGDGKDIQVVVGAVPPLPD